MPYNFYHLLMKVRRLGQTFFAEITEVDLARLDDWTFAEIRKAHLEHGVVVFRDQRLTPEQHIAFSARFGPLQVHPMMQFNLEGAPEILMVSSDKHADGRPKGIADAGRYWHTDMSYMPEPALGSLLYARAIPDEGGDTLFCDMTAACRDLPPEKLEALLNAKAVHHFASRWARESAKAGMRPQQTKEEQDRNPPVEHPMIRTHPETGEPAIYAGGFVVSIKNSSKRPDKQKRSPARSSVHARRHSTKSARRSTARRRPACRSRASRTSRSASTRAPR